MDGKKQWWWVLPLFLCYLPCLVWAWIRNRINPPPKTPALSAWDGHAWTVEEEEAWRELEAKQQVSRSGKKP